MDITHLGFVDRAATHNMHEQSASTTPSTTLFILFKLRFGYPLTRPIGILTQVINRSLTAGARATDLAWGFYA